jgi:hypothetical protein
MLAAGEAETNLTNCANLWLRPCMNCRKCVLSEYIGVSSIIEELFSLLLSLQHRPTDDSETVYHSANAAKYTSRFTNSFIDGLDHLIVFCCFLTITG